MRQAVLRQHPPLRWQDYIYRFGQATQSLGAESACEKDATLKANVSRLSQEVRHLFLELQQVANKPQLAKEPDARTTWRDYLEEFDIVALLLYREIGDKSAEPGWGDTRYLDDVTNAYMLEPKLRYIEDLRDLYGQVRDLHRQLWELRIRSPEPPSSRTNKRRASRTARRTSRLGRRLRSRGSTNGRNH